MIANIIYSDFIGLIQKELGYEEMSDVVIAELPHIGEVMWEFKMKEERYKAFFDFKTRKLKALLKIEWLQK